MATMAILDRLRPKIYRLEYWRLWITLKPKAKQILKLHIFPIQDGRRGDHPENE